MIPLRNLQEEKKIGDELVKHEWPQQFFQAN